MSNFSFKRLEATSIFFSANISGCRIPCRRSKRDAFLLLLLNLMASVLDVEKVAERAENHEKGDRVKGPRACLDELVSPHQELGFNPMEVFTPNE
jgi:hypothetical protein